MNHIYLNHELGAHKEIERVGATTVHDTKDIELRPYGVKSNNPTKRVAPDFMLSKPPCAVLFEFEELVKNKAYK